jgi:hypothetical protein
MTIDNTLDFTQQHTPGPWTVDDLKMTAGLRERRRDKRINVTLPVLLDNAEGVTRDVSASGVFFWTNGMYPLGDSIRFSMGRTSDSRKLMLKCRGVVWRTVPRGKAMGVAVKITEPVVDHNDVMSDESGVLRTYPETPL